MSKSIPRPFDRRTKVLVLAGANAVSERGRRIEAERIVRGAPEVPLEDKAFLTLRGRLVIEYVLDCLGEFGFERRWVLGKRECLDRIPPQHDFTPLAQLPGSTIGANLAAAHGAILPEPDEPILVVFGDHPLMTPTALSEFLAACARGLHEADFFHGVAVKTAYEAFSKHFHRTSLHTREIAGRVTGLNVVIPSRLHRFRVFDRVYAVRKLEQFRRFVTLLGHLIDRLRWRCPHALLDSACMYLAKEFEKMACRRGWLGSISTFFEQRLQHSVRLARIETYAARLLGAERGVSLVSVNHGGAAIDVDFYEELAILEQNWDQLLEITSTQDAASQTTDLYEVGRASSSRYAAR